MLKKIFNNYFFAIAMILLRILIVLLAQYSGDFAFCFANVTFTEYVTLCMHLYQLAEQFCTVRWWQH